MCYQVQYYDDGIDDGNVHLLKVDAPLVTLTSGAAYNTSNHCHSIECKTEEILPGEYIIEAHPEGMMERLIFTTNKRIIFFGIQRHECLDRKRMSLQAQVQHIRPSLARKIVAFGGSCYKDRRLKIAYFTESINWILVGNFVSLRRLVEDGRATRKCKTTEIEHPEHQEG